MLLTYFFVTMIWSWWWLCYGCCYADCRAIYRRIESRRWWRRLCTKMRFDINSSRRILFFCNMFLTFWHVFTNSESIRIRKSFSKKFPCFLFLKKRRLCSYFKRKQDTSLEKKMLINRFGIRENITIKPWFRIWMNSNQILVGAIIINVIYVAKLWNIHWTKILQNTPSCTELVPEQLGICRESCLESSLDCKTFWTSLILPPLGTTWKSICNMYIL